MKSCITNNRLAKSSGNEKFSQFLVNSILTLLFFTSILASSYGQVFTCTGSISDSGGPVGDYSNNEDVTETYCSDSGNEIKLTFTSFDLEENFDFLYIYDGPDDMSPVIGVYTNSSSPGSVVSSNGCLTVVFQSDASTTAAGYEADISCVAACDIVITGTTLTNATCGNSDGTITVTATGAVGTLEYSIDAGLNFFPSGVFVGLPEGLYQVAVRYSDETCTVFNGLEDIESGCVEICGNGIDDDGDSLVDSADPDCDYTVVSCSGVFFDDAGAGIPTAPLRYTNDTTYTQTFCADNGANIQATFTTFELSLQGAPTSIDTLIVFDGADINAPVIGKYTGLSSGMGEQFRAKSFFQSTDGCLTFQLKANLFGNAEGWEGFLSCTNPPGFGLEICGNGIDDDGDGMTDFQDPDCPEALDQINCEQGFSYFIPPVWKMQDVPAGTYATPGILCLSTSFASATVNLSSADGSFSRDINLTNAASDSIFFNDNTDVLRTDVNNAIETSKGLIVTSDVPIQMLYILDGVNNKTLMTVKGVESKGKSFRVGSQTNTLVQSELGKTRDEHHFISVVATEDNTTVDFVFSTPIEGVVGNTLTINLDRGESYLVINEEFNVTVSGSLVTADKEIVVASGSQHTSAQGVTEDDGGVDMLVPARSIGTEYVLIRGGVEDAQDYGIVVAIENTTVVNVDGVETATLNAGEFIQVNVTGALGEGTYIETSKSAYVYQVSGLSLGEVGMAIVAPIGDCRGDQFASFSRFNATAQFALNIVIKDTGLATLEFNGVDYSTYATAVTQPVAALPGYSTVTIRDADIAVDNFVSSDEFFNAAILIGDPIFAGTFGFITSFSEKVNILDPAFNEPVDFYVMDTVCRGDTINHTLSTLSCGNTDKIRGIEQGVLGTATVTDDLSIRYISNGSVGEDVIQVTVINEFGVQSAVCLGIRIDSLMLEFNPNDTTICAGDVIVLAPDTIGGTGPYTYEWSTMETVPAISVPGITEPAAPSYRYSVTVTDALGCTGIDTMNVSILPNIVADAGPDAMVCTGDFATIMATQPVGTTGMWSGGAGVFGNASNATTTYTPDPSDPDTVKLFWALAGTSGSQCFSGTDSMNVIITPGLAVFAGDDTYICIDSEIELADLNAQIFSTTVTTGQWLTGGDGVFMPGSTATGSFPSSTTYIPGPNDNATGSFLLTLTANNGTSNPCETGSDQVQVFINETPVLACNDNLNISVNSDCTVTLNADMLIENPIDPEDFYTITLKDEYGNHIYGLTLNSAYIGRTIEYSVGYECGNNTCWGNITIEDKLIPDLEPTSYTVDCRDEVDPLSIGFPIPFGSSIFSVDDYFIVEGFDGCGDVVLTYEDDINDFVCDGPYMTVIYRNWLATDESGNTATGQDTINVDRISLAEVVLPPHYDDFDEPTLNCSTTYPLTDEGFPSPEYTGYPNAGYCNMIQSTFTDISFPMCGNTYKVLREWLIFDWCTSTSITYFQTIKITDKTPPSIVCPQNVSISTDYYSCNSGLVLLGVPTVSDNCSDVETTSKVSGPSNEYIEVIDNGNLVVADLPLGTSTVTYTAYDECDNSNSCSYTITVFDNVPPTPVCEGHTKVSINNVGNARLYATSIDDGSYDNCEIAAIRIAKMSDACGYGSGAFGPYVDFCCNEIGGPIMVAFEVTDIYGNANICMTEVELEDKIAPEIEAPTDLTIACTTDFDEDDLSQFGVIALSQGARQDIVINDSENNGVVGIDGIAIDNCNTNISEVVDINIDCGVGEIRRTFTVVDNYDQKMSDVQTITIVNSQPFDGNDINFPNPVTVNGCNNLDTHPDVTGRPTWDNDACAAILTSYEDKTFTVADSACLLVLREWKVLDQCQFNANTGEGVWYAIQSIKLNNLVSPTFTSTCADTTVCTYGECEGNVFLTIEAEDDCTDASQLVYSYGIDAGADGSVDDTGQGNTINKTMADGTYRILWKVEDLCGNIETCSYILTVEDCKLPTPYCLSGISTALMNNVGEVEIFAYTFNQGSFDNCTGELDLTYSFSSDVNDISLLITCDMIENGVAQTLELDMWVTDEAGNQDYCPVMVNVQDNFDICPNTGSATVGGRIEDDFEESIVGANIILSSEYPDGNKTFMTEDAGTYAFYDLPHYVNYNITPLKNDDMVNGISTLDIVLIQKHILGIEVFTDARQYIAADVNKSDGITGTDMVQLRKALLGYYVEFPDNTSWRFYDKDYEFSANSYYDFPEYIAASPLMDDMTDADFVGVKIGDVNGTATPGLLEDNIDTRSNETMELELQVNKANNSLELIATETFDLIGMQWELNWDNAQLLDVKANALKIYDAQMRIEQSTLKVAYHNEEAAKLDENQILFELVFEEGTDLARIANDIVINPTWITPELYNSKLEIFNVKIGVREDLINDKLSELFLYQNSPNPFEGTTIISYDLPGNDKVELQILDASGKIVYRNVKKSEKGYNQITITESDLSSSGVYYYQLNTKFGTATRKMILLK